MKLLDVAGLVLIVAAGALAWLPLGPLFAGLSCLLVSWSMARSKEGR